MARGRKPDEVKSVHLRFEGLRKPGANRREDVTLEWYKNLPSGNRFAMAFELLTAALNGELGEAIRQAVEESDVEKAQQASERIFSAFVFDEED